MKKILATVLAFILLLGVFSGCTLVEDDDSNVVIATVNGKSILKSDYDDMYNYYYEYYLSMYQSYGYDASYVKTMVDSMSAQFLDSLIQDEVVRQKAESEKYFEYTDEHRAAAQAVIDENRNSYVDNLAEQYKLALAGQEIHGKNEGESDEDFFKRKALEKYEQDLKDSGTSEAEMLEEQLRADAVDRFIEDKLKNVVALDADVIAEYDAIAKEQEQEFTTDAIYVKARNGESITLSSGTTATYDTFAYNRKGYSYVQHILISFEEEDVTKLKAISSTMAEYDEEIEARKATIEKETDEAKKAEEQAALDAAQKTRDELKEQYDLAIKEATAKIQAKTDEVYNAVKDGDEANFIKVMIEKTEDTGMTTEEAAKKGYLVGPEDGMVEEFSTAARELEEGKISEPVATQFGYHIIRCIEKIPEGKVPYEDVKEELTEKMTEERKSQEWQALTTAWTAEADIKRYEDRI